MVSVAMGMERLIANGGSMKDFAILIDKGEKESVSTCISP
jgi:hypothetical protein